MVSGAIALLLQRYPNLTPNQVKWLVTHGARSLTTRTVGTGAGQVELGTAARLVDGSIGEANKGLTPNQLVALAYLAQTSRPASELGFSELG